MDGVSASGVSLDGTSSPIVVAVSGGSDSLALLCLAKAWGDLRGLRVLAVTIDHRLRPEAAQEAQHVAAICAGLGIAHETRVWDDPKPSAKHARMARYRLLSAFAAAHDAHSIWLGHTHDDQLETLLIRLHQGTHLYGAGGIDVCAPAPYWGDYTQNISLFRPLLGMARADLRTFLSAQSVGWIDDPSNTNMSYLRPNVRQLLCDNPKTAIAVDGVAQQAARYRARHQYHATKMLGLCRARGDIVIVPRAGLSLLALKTLVQTVSGKMQSVRDSRAQGLITRMGEEDVFRSTLHNCIISVRRREIVLSPEYPETAPEVPHILGRLAMCKRNYAANAYFA